MRNSLSCSAIALGRGPEVLGRNRWHCIRLQTWAKLLNCATKVQARLQEIEDEWLVCKPFMDIQQ